MIFLPKVKNSLIEFIYLDIVTETLNLVCQNYINKLISDCRNKTKEEIKNFIDRAKVIGMSTVEI